MRFDIITIFPKIFSARSSASWRTRPNTEKVFGGDSCCYFNYSILKRAQERRLIKITAHNLRDYAKGKHKQVDDRPYGGGPGMVLKVEPIFKAVEAAKRKSRRAKRWRVILFSTRGEKLDSKMAKRLSKYDQLILICGRYEGVDERVAKYIADEEISIGDYVLSGGELPAMVLTEAVSRYIPDVLGKYESLEEVKGSYPVYTRPPGFKAKSKMGKVKNLKVPKVLLSGSHKKIDEWRGLL